MKHIDAPSPAPVDDRAERERLARVYGTYASDPYYRRIWSASAASSFMSTRKWQAIAKMLSDMGIDTSGKQVLDLGAGEGGDCTHFMDLGVKEGRLVALDILQERAGRARKAHSGLASMVGNAEHLPFVDESFDVVYQSTMLSSVLDADRRARILEEAKRVLRRGGVFLSYDVRYPNPWNANTRPVGGSELGRAFSGWPVRIRSVTALPPLVRWLAPVSTLACRALESVALLRSHLLAVARKP
jgi:SAM-dependent methyltransferase